MGGVSAFGNSVVALLLAVVSLFSACTSSPSSSCLASGFLSPSADFCVAASACCCALSFFFFFVVIERHHEHETDLNERLQPRVGAAENHAPPDADVSSAIGSARGPSHPMSRDSVSRS